MYQSASTMFRSMWAGLDPDGYFRRQAGRPEPFRSVPRGIAVVPHSEVWLTVIGRR